jgi:hypothetical protein
MPDIIVMASAIEAEKAAHPRLATTPMCSKQARESWHMVILFEHAQDQC